MKKFICAMLVILSLSGCVANSVSEDKKSHPEFVEIGVEKYCSIVYHKQTGVVYIMSNTPQSKGVYTVMVDRSGKPLVYMGD